jgi:hypothetical protein
MKIANSIPKPSSEAPADRALYLCCDAAISLAFILFAVLVTLIVWCPLELIQHSLHLCAPHGTQGGRV